MKIGIFSDIHANVHALKPVIESFNKLGTPIDMYVCLGDVVGYGANPNECCQIVRELAAITIMGNHDAAVCGEMDYSFYYEGARKALDWHAAQLEQTHHEWLRTLPYTHEMDDICFCHGSPVDAQAFDYIFNLEQANALLEHWDELKHITFIGHSHLTKAFSIDQEGGAVELIGPVLEFMPDKKYIVTVGSVGQPRDNDNRSCFGVYCTESKTFTFHRQVYDICAAARAIFESDLSSDFGKRLFFGI